MPAAASFALCTTSTEKVVKAFESAASKVQRPAVALVFLAGPLAKELPQLALAMSQRVRGVPFLLAVGAAVMNEHLEIEGQAGVSGLVWADPTASVLVLDPEHDDHGTLLKRAMNDARASLAILLMRPDRLEPGAFSGLSLERRVVFGGGTSSAQNIFAVDAEGRLSEGPLASILSRGVAPLVATTRASRLISPLSPVTKYRGNMLLEIDGEHALDVLNAAGHELEGQPLIFVAVANASVAQASSARGPEVQLRPIQGVDPNRRGIVLSEELEPDSYAAFAIRDAAAARSDMQAMVREMARDSAGALPRFAIYVNCAGRGSGLYESTNVDTRLLRSRFGDLPLVGFQSAFELAPHGNKLALHLYTGVLALFTSPS